MQMSQSGSLVFFRGTLGNHFVRRVWLASCRRSQLSVLYKGELYKRIFASKMDSSQYIETLLEEKSTLDPNYHPNTIRLIDDEIKRVETGEIKKHDMDSYNNNSEDAEVKEPRHKGSRRVYEIEVEPRTKLTEKVMIPIKKFPKFNFVGRLLGPKGHTFKRLQNLTGCKMSILGKGSMRDREKEKEHLESGDTKYSHLQEELHVLIEVEAPKAEAHGRLAGAISEVQKFLVPDPHDPIRQEQMRELAYLNGYESDGKPGTPTNLPPVTSAVIPAPIAVRGRGRARGVAVRGAHVVRRAVQAHSIQPASIAAVGTPRHGATAPETYTYETYDGYEYEPYQESEVIYYTDYPAPETYPPTSGTVRLKAPLRSIKATVRESTYPY